MEIQQMEKFIWTNSVVKENQISNDIAFNHFDPKTEEGKTEKIEGIYSLDEINKNIQKLNNHLESNDIDVKFGYNDKIDSMYVSVIEKSSGVIIRKIPTEEIMNFREQMNEIIGNILNIKG